MIQFVQLMNMRTRFGGLVSRACLAIALVGLLCVPATFAASVKGVQLDAQGSSQVVKINLDQAGEYQVYDLEAPKRVAVSLPSYSMAEGIAAIKGSGGVGNVFPVQDENGVRIEIGLTQGATYQIKEDGNALLVSIAPAPAAATQAQGAQIKDILARDRGGFTELTLRGENMDANHNAFITNGGRTLIVDFWGGESKLPKEYFAYSTQKITGVTVGATEDRVRLVVALLPNATAKHQISASKNQMVIRFGDVKKEKLVAGAVVESVDFQPDDRIAHLIIRTNTGEPIVNLAQKDGRVELIISNAQLLAGQERSQDVSAFPGPVKQVDSYKLGKDVKIVARLRQDVEVTSFQSGNVLTINLVPNDLARSDRQSEAVRGGALAYSGQKVSFDFKDIDIKNALKLIADMSDLNIIMSDDVSGTLTMRLFDVPWDQALDLILAARGLGKEQAGNVMRIAPLAVLKADAIARKAATQGAEDIAPLETEFIELGYASVNDVKVILEGGSVKEKTPTQGVDAAASKTPEGNGSSSSGGELKLLSERGSILMDERSNTIIITDTRERLNNIKRLVAWIDKPVQQVLIESRIVEASNRFSRELGVKWGGTYNDTVAAGNKFSHTVTGGLGGNIVDLPSQTLGGAIGYTLGTVSGALNLNLELSAAETEGKIKVVSSPRVFTSNLQEALIEQDEQIPFAQTTFAGGVATTSSTQVSSKLTLKVTPQVTADKSIIMKLKVNKDTPRENNLIPGGDPIINKKTIETNLLVQNGETVVLGGIYSQTLAANETGVPFFKDIPILGYLFKREVKTDDRSELLIFITPTIIDNMGRKELTQR